MNFELENLTTVKLDNVQTRMEKHGEENVPAIDLAMTLTANNKALDMLHKSLRGALFCNLGQPQADVQTEMDLPVDELPNIRFSKMTYPIKIDEEGAGYTMRIDHGLGGDSDMILSLCKVKAFKVTPIEGGSVEIKFTASSSADIDERISGKLSMLQQSEISIKLIAPVAVEPATVTPIKSRKKMTKDEAQAAAQELFLAGEDAKDAAALTH